MDADAHQSLGGQYGVRGFPTIKVFGSNKNSPSDYQGNESYLVGESTLSNISVSVYRFVTW